MKSVSVKLSDYNVVPSSSSFHDILSTANNMQKLQMQRSLCAEELEKGVLLEIEYLCTRRARLCWRGESVASKFGGRKCGAKI